MANQVRPDDCECRNEYETCPACVRGPRYTPFPPPPPEVTEKVIEELQKNRLTNMALNSVVTGKPTAPERPSAKPMTDNVNHPPHYTAGGIECIDAIKAQLTEEEYRGYLKGNVVKYLWREKHKGGAESLSKALWYLKRLVNG